MIFIVIVGFFLIWSCLGSFSGVLLEKKIKRSFFTGRSRCTSCKKQLEWYELIPVFSYLLQWWKCRKCGEKIPLWVFLIEFFMGILWTLFWTYLFLNGTSWHETLFFLLPLSFLLILAVEDAKTFTIPDKLSLPMIAITCLIIALAGINAFPSFREAIIGAIVGMIFYLLQMMIPAIKKLLEKKKYSDIPDILILPIMLPFWLTLKAVIGEKKADKYLPSISTIDKLPTWVGGGDARLGILAWLVTWPLGFFIAVWIGYTSGIIVWLVSILTQKKPLTILPVAPLIFVGVFILCIWKIIFE